MEIIIKIPVLSCSWGTLNLLAKITDISYNEAVSERAEFGHKAYYFGQSAGLW
jgi:hypothetical protein